MEVMDWGIEVETNNEDPTMAIHISRQRHSVLKFRYSLIVCCKLSIPKLGW